MLTYPDSVNIEVVNTATFVWAQDVTDWATEYNLDNAVFVAQMRLTANNPVVTYTFSSANGGIMYTKFPASGSIVFTANPTNGTTVTVGTTNVTFVSSGASGLQVNIGGSLAVTLASFLALPALATDSQLSLVSPYSVSNFTLNLSAKNPGVVGNSVAIATTVVGATASGPTLTGGAHTITLMAPLSATEAFSGVYFYDCRLETNEAQYVPMFGGTITWDQGVTREANDSFISLDTIPSATYAALQPNLQNSLIFG
jgi:hypothetical protein